MSIMTINDLGVTLADTPFSDLTFTISRGDRIGLVAANVRGKSTLLACRAGGIEPTTGDNIRARGLRVGHVRQNLPDEALKQTL